MYKKIKDFLVRKNRRFNEIHAILKYQHADIKSPKINLGRIQATLNAQKGKIDNLSEVEFQVFSQFGDDGIIQYLIQKLPIKNKTFIEFGVEDYRESNTRFLLVNNYWSGMVMDGDVENVRQIKSGLMHNFYDIRARQCFITKENINQVLEAEGFDPEVGILSIDIDGNDYWVWKEINVIKPSVIICEYNSLFGYEEAVTIPYRPDFIRGKSTPLNFYGISLQAACLIARERGYFFIGCNSAGNNAYFIHESLKPVCPIGEKTAREGYNFASFSETWDAAKEPRRGKDKVMSIHGQVVYDTIVGSTKEFDGNKVVESLLAAGKFRGIHY